MRKGNGVALREFRKIKLLLQQRLQEGGSISQMYDEFFERGLITISRSSFYNHIHRHVLEQKNAAIPSCASNSEQGGV